MSSDTIVRYSTTRVPNSPGFVYSGGVLTDWVNGSLDNAHGECVLEKQSGSDGLILSGDTYVF